MTALQAQTMQATRAVQGSHLSAHARLLLVTGSMADLQRVPGCNKYDELSGLHILELVSLPLQLAWADEQWLCGQGTLLHTWTMRLGSLGR